MHIATTLQFDKGQRKILKRAWERPPFMVAKRNARERTRVHAVNQAFVALKFHLPAIRSNAKRVSKLKILRAAITYIAALTDLLRGNADFPKLKFPETSNQCCDKIMNIPFRSKRENQVSNKNDVMKREESQQRQQRTEHQNIHDTA
ncbi:Helix-loop-helix DNA-binding domain protein [Onchocerca flexuosa]|uniref:Helix-loop-helix DNA-binding domain protein n=1 Tax=Onchocerca flexuosa TaxID=387005 RepID=A0A238C319_9BILA|nr:Helix-loop-helix DNA-binding domain protein [Onchocerca flexuosa]